MKKIYSVILVFLLTACSEEADVDGYLEASLRLGWIPSGTFSGEVSGQALFAEGHGLSLEINSGGPSLNTIALVASGQDTFGTLAADEVLLANENGADLVIIGVINQISPGAFVALPESEIESPNDFPGKIVGVLPFGSTTLLYEAMLQENGIDRSSITEQTISPDLRAFLTGVYDVHPVFVYDETVTLDMEGYEYNLIEPSDFGISFIGPVYFTSRSVAENSPEIVRAFVRTMVDGWQYALENNDEAIELLATYSPDINVAREKLVLLKGMDYFRAFNNEPVNSSLESWEVFVSKLVELGALATEPSLTDSLKLEWVQEYYQELELN